ncbi:bifunctional diguanylate cyclase/phosphodiesterase [Sedimentibacter hydroxybenzoicus DSM 7310]|uniref:Bifunctional diguanylate cyclase/phosphodiesterase n=1 Tax=Sedimentibacter hydroxybenzoicus DSM 7310 TaxID=1123245 RepID=A0A974GV11_SEDHY|nr:bifunctional diguanylate cyclase/phosphodiesterase [Sedimentibacter hydroxybenzoicus]NYB72893.1 bifunctional diguanylate cyclase/phosphodiesterase [Sedimentibacter hydroxybenzoicus DSM 7310]
MKNNGNEDLGLFNELNNFIKSNGALTIVLKYGVFGVLWIILSDSFLYVLAGDSEQYRNIQTFKGWIYVALTMIIIYILINNREKRIKYAITECNKAINECNFATKELEHIAYYDKLTGLPNRTMFYKTVTNMANDPETEFAVVFIDIDNFKFINDTLGHYVGDEFLKYMGDKISEELVHPDMVARVGGDEFALLVINYESKEKLLKKLDNLIRILGETWNYEGRDFFVSVSMGVAFYPEDGQNFDTLLKHSDVAMYNAKTEGKNKISFYEKNIHEKSNNFILMSNKIQKGLTNKEFILFYQPQIELRTGKITGMEALVRWNHLGEGFVPPNEFIRVAEATGQIYELENRIIRNVLAQKKEWEERGFSDLELSFNLSSKSLIRDSKFEQIEELLSEYDLDYTNIVIEITETAVISNIDLAVERLNILREKGFKIALDDFGTGFSSLTYLMMLPIDIIKLDKSYVCMKNMEDKDIHIIKFVVSLAHEFGFKVVAEGIETKEQLENLISIGCEYGQGFFLGIPMDIDSINALLQVTAANL